MDSYYLFGVPDMLGRSFTLIHTQVSPVVPVKLFRYGILLFSTIAIAKAVQVLLWSIWRFKAPVDLPVLNLENSDLQKATDRWKYDYRGILQEGYNKFKHGAYQLWTPDGFVVILSPELLPEIRNLPDTICDFYSGVAASLLGEHKFLDLSGSLPIHGLKKNLTTNIGLLIPDIMDELFVAMDKNLPKNPEWTAMPCVPVVTQIVTPLIGRLFVGQETCRSEEWMNTQITFNEAVLTAAQKLRQVPYLFKPLFAPFVRDIRILLQCLLTARRLLTPVIMARSLGRAAPTAKRPEDLLQFVMEGSELENPPTSMPRQAEQALIISFGGNSAISAATAHILYDLATYPSHIGPLREEVNAIWDELDGNLTRQSLSRMVKLDSFMKESQRLNPANQSTINRVMRTDYTLSNGLHLPKGVRLAVPSSPVSLDPNNWENPERFDGFRFSRLRASRPENANKFQFPTPSSKSLDFGSGRHLCPGRFIATVEIKLIMSYILRHYDLRLHEPSKGRPENVIFGPSNAPNPNAKIEFRRIRELPAIRV